MIIKGINEFGNLIPITLKEINKVKLINGVYEIVASGGRLLYFHSVDKPKILEPFLSQKREIPRLQTSTRLKSLRPRNSRYKPGFIRVFRGVCS